MMKRKLDADDRPVSSSDGSINKSDANFSSYGFDARLLQALAKSKFSAPTAVQAKVIPLALAGRDVLARSKTGSGKTAAYLLPILQSILRRKPGTDEEIQISALILVPTRELAEQVLKAISSLTAYCADDIRAVNLTHKTSDAVQRSLLTDSPDIVIATPARAALNAASGALKLDHLSHLVVDEADLVFSYGYEKDLQNVAEVIPRGLQTFLMSATLTTEVQSVKGLFCREPEVVQLDEDDDSGGQLRQFVIRCGEDEKFLLLFVVFKLKLIRGKCLIFVGDIDRCYRLRLYLEQFGIKACVLNSELPLNSRIHVVEEFNKNIYEIIIATDENEASANKHDDAWNGAQTLSSGAHGRVEEGGQSSSAAQVTGDQETTDNSSKKHSNTAKRKQFRLDKEYGVARGIDFKDVACVLNFDLPTSATSYVHRIGRTARAGNSGMALSFVVPRELYRKHKPTSFPTAKDDEVVLEQIMKDQKEKGKDVVPYQFDMKQVIAFRYRMEDALRAVTRLAVREARTREIRQELLKSERLKRHFEENPKDLQQLRHDNDLRAARIQSHLKHVPDYLLPQNSSNGRGLIGTGRTGEEVTLEDLTKVDDKPNSGMIRARRCKVPGRRKDAEKGDGSRKARHSSSGSNKRRKMDPLKSFKSK